MRTESLAVLLPLTLAITGCDPSAKTKNNVVLGAILDRTGINSELSWGDALTLAQAHVNLALEEAGYKNMAFRIPIRDSAGQADPALTEAISLVKVGVKEGLAKGLLLATSDEDLAIHKLYYDADPANDLAVPLVCASCTSSSINSPTATATDPVQQAAWRNADRWNFRGIMSTKLVARVLASLVVKNGDANQDGKVKVSFYGVNDSFGTGAGKDLDNELKAQLDGGAPYVMEAIYHPREVDTNSYGWSQDVGKLVDGFNEATSTTDGFPDIVVSANLVLQESAYTRAYKESGAKIRTLHFHTFRASSALRAIAQLAEGEEGVSHLLVEKDESGRVFQEDYMTAFGTPIVYRDAIYYDTAMTLMLAAVKATIPLDDPTSVTGTQIRDAMVSMAQTASQGTVIRTGKDEVLKALVELKASRPINYQGASGPMDLDANFNVVDKLAHFQVVDGLFTDVAVFDCVSSSTCPMVP
jgi:ABC-type branched-subunit amino acid transport system substrate-binding protein